MAIDFNGTTSKLENTTASGFDVDTLTILAWAFADGQGENSFGRIFQADESANAGNFSSGVGFFLSHQNAANRFRFNHSFTSQLGVWSFPATDNQWNPIALSYDRRLTTNDPVARVGYASETVTRDTGPTGTAVAPPTGYCIGNRGEQTRTWDGMLAHIMIYNVILTADEMDLGLRRPGSVRRGLVFWAPMAGALDNRDLVSAQNATITSVANRTPQEPAVPGWMLSSALMVN